MESSVKGEQSMYVVSSFSALRSYRLGGGVTHHRCLGLAVAGALLLTFVVPASALSAPRHGLSYKKTSELSLGVQSTTGGLLGLGVAVSDNGRTVLASASARAVKGKQGAGAGEIFTLSGGKWKRTELGLGSAARGADGLGDPLAMSANGNVVVLVTSHRVAAYVFRRSNGAWGKPVAIKSPGDLLINSVALGGDGNTLLLGIGGQTVAGVEYAGAGEVYTYTGSEWTGPVQLDMGSEPGGSMGSTAALSFDGTTAILGAEALDVGATGSAGAVQVFHNDAGVWSHVAQLDLGTDSAFGGQFGWAISMNGAGTEVVGSTRNEVNGQSSKGVAAIFTLSGGTWSRTLTIKNGENAPGLTKLGTSVAMSRDGTTAVVAANHTVGKNLITSPEVYKLQSGVWTPSARINVGRYIADCLVAISANGSTAIIGNPERAVMGRSRAGIVLVFQQH
jgi:hypothetical protein